MDIDEAIKQARVYADALEQSSSIGIGLTIGDDGQGNATGHVHLEVEALRALVAAAEAGRWRPITEEDPAPHGVPVLLCSPPCITHPDGWEYEAGLASGGRRFQGGSTMWFHGTATHWRPLPPAPEA